MKANPLITVAIPSLNQGRFLDAALRSVFSQPLSVEVIVVDGGSTDESHAVIERWRDRIAWFRSAPDNGQAAAINEAIKRGHAPFVCWLNSDDLYAPRGLAALHEVINSDLSNDVVYGNCHQIDALGDWIGRSRSRSLSARSLSRRNPIPQPASLIRRSAWEKVGGLDESLHFSLDYDLWWRLYRAGARFKRIKAVVAATRHHEQAKSFAFVAQQYTEGKMLARRHNASLPLIWHIRSQYSVRARTGNRILKYFSRIWRKYM